MNEQAFLQLLGSVLGDEQPHWPFRDALRQDLRGLDHHRRTALMTAEEQSLWEQLPLVVPVYRGCYWENVDGLAWSLVPGLASSFPLSAEFRQEGSPLLVSGDVERESCIVKLNGRRVDIISCEVMAGQPVQIPPRGH
ncbi:hypothetical protein FHT39_000325 [Mitsuaria sp. BK045]|uniref:hypothetical protein n=1 Tax=unclassified Roseateles TaxID=2626991 RepID=UPI001620F84E|nr:MULTISPECIES: hypothetical protein [unclassified Roseateles]MBB3291686.1 hypothetical protein [Mitsuaria sp. BK041]MBB3360903.1 hypothetical protein [Mitsuaria sp. BK045]